MKKIITIITLIFILNSCSSVYILKASSTSPTYYHDLLTPCETPILFSQDESPIVPINDEESFILFAQSVNGGENYQNKMIILENDLNLEGYDWESIGKAEFPFRGIFEGNHHRIKIGKNSIPLFLFANGAEIHNVTLVGDHISSLIKNAINVTTSNCSINT